MEVKEFINKIAPIAVKDWKERHIVLPSITIAQCIKESGHGESELALNANALCGVKAGSNWNGPTYTKVSKEWQNGKYVEKNSTFRAYTSWKESIIDHNSYIGEQKIGKQKEPNFKEVVGEVNVKRAIAGLIGNACRQDNIASCTDQELAEFVKNGKTEYTYATSPNYAQSLLTDYIEKYNLTQYDSDMDKTTKPEQTKNIQSFNIHAGHNPSKMVACGSVGYLNESDENRTVCKGLVEKINSSGNIAYDCTCNNGTSQKDVLKKIVAKCNTNNVDYNISIHFNALSKSSKDGKTKGVEVWINPKLKGTMTESIAKNICNSVSKLGFANRGVKYSDTLYVLKNLSNCMLIECCFVDDEDDFLLYNPSKMIDSIFNGLNINIIPKDEAVSDKLYYVIAGVYSKLDNAKSLQEILAKNGYLANDEGNLIKGIVTQIKEFGKE